MNKQDIIDKHKKIVDEHLDNFHPPFHSSESLADKINKAKPGDTIIHQCRFYKNMQVDPGYHPKPTIPLGNIPELKIIELLKDIESILFWASAIIIGLLLAIIALP